MLAKKKAILVHGMTIQLSRKHMKNLRLSISRPEGEVRLSVPYFVTKNEITDFVGENRQWILDEQAKVIALSKDRQMRWRDGDTFRFFDRKLRVSYIESKQKRLSVSIEEDDEIFQVFVPPNLGLSDTDIEKKVAAYAEKFLRQNLLEKACALTEKWRVVLGLDVNEVRIKKMKTRWGTCNIADKRIWLSLSLTSFPPMCLEYVVVHELVHLIERNHTKRFWQIVDDAYPLRHEAEALLAGKKLN